MTLYTLDNLERAPLVFGIATPTGRKLVHGFDSGIPGIAILEHLIRSEEDGTVHSYYGPTLTKSGYRLPGRALWLTVDRAKAAARRLMTIADFTEAETAEDVQSIVGAFDPVRTKQLIELINGDPGLEQLLPADNDEPVTIPMWC